MCARFKMRLAAPALDVEIGEGSFPLTVDVRFKFGHSKPFTHIRMALWKGARSSDLRLTGAGSGYSTPRRILHLALRREATGL